METLDRETVVRRMKTKDERLYRDLVTGRCSIGLSRCAEEAIPEGVFNELAGELSVSWLTCVDGIVQYGLVEPTGTDSTCGGSPGLHTSCQGQLGH